MYKYCQKWYIPARYNPFNNVYFTSTVNINLSNNCEYSVFLCTEMYKSSCTNSRGLTNMQLLSAAWFSAFGCIKNKKSTTFRCYLSKNFYDRLISVLSSDMLSSVTNASSLKTRHFQNRQQKILWIQHVHEGLLFPNLAKREYLSLSCHILAI